MIVDQLKVGNGITDLLAIGESGAAQHAVRNRRARKGFFDALCLGVGAVEDGKVAVGRLLFKDQLGHGAHDLARLGVLIVAQAQMELGALVAARPKAFALSSHVVGDDGIGGIQNVLR